MTTATKTSNLPIRAYTDGSALILKRVPFANGKFYDIRICEYDRKEKLIAIDEKTPLSPVTLGKIQRAVARMFAGCHNDPSQYTIWYKNQPESCILENFQSDQPMELINETNDEDAIAVVEGAREIYQYLLPQIRTAMTSDSDVQLVSHPTRISESEKKRWRERGEAQVELDTPENLTPSSVQFPDDSIDESLSPLKKAPIRPTEEGNMAAPPVASAISPDSPDPEDRRVFNLLDTIPLNFQGQTYKYSDLYEYRLEKDRDRDYDWPPVCDALQNVIANPRGSDEKEIRAWLEKLYLEACRFYAYKSGRGQKESAARVVLMFLARVNTDDYFNHLMKIEPMVGIRIRQTDVVIEQGDITRATGVKAIVNAANRKCLGGEGVDGAIHKAAGPMLREECEFLDEDENGDRCKTGDAVLTHSANLHSRGIDYVIHAVGPNKAEHGIDIDLLKKTYKSALEVARENGIRTIAFPAISTKIYGHPLKQSTEAALEAITEYLEEHPGSFDTIKLIFFTQEDYAVATSVIN